MYDAFMKERLNNSGYVIRDLFVRWSGEDRYEFLGDTRRPVEGDTKLRFLWMMLLIDENPPVV